MNIKNQPLLFSVQLAMVVSLYVVVIAAINVFFSIVDIWWFDPAASPWEYQSASSSIRYGVAVLLVFVPIYLGILYSQRKVSSDGGEGTHYLSVTQWLVYLSLVVVGIAIAFQLVNVILAFLEGELTVRLLAKALGLAILTVTPAAYHWCDLHGYWQSQRGRHRLVLIGYALVFSLLVALGIYTIDSPTEARERSLDQRQLQDLQDVSWRIDDYVRVHDTLPDTLAAVYQRPGDVPTAPSDRPDYAYNLINLEEFTYELCATFYHASGTLDEQVMMRTGRSGTMMDWHYEAREWCFDLAVNLE